MKIYIVYNEYHDYDEHYWYNVIAYTDETVAKATADHLNATLPKAVKAAKKLEDDFERRGEQAFGKYQKLAFKSHAEGVSLEWTWYEDHRDEYLKLAQGPIEMMAPDTQIPDIDSLYGVHELELI